jgi:hypothetical protein
VRIKLKKAYADGTIAVDMDRCRCGFVGLMRERPERAG